MKTDADNMGFEVAGVEPTTAHSPLDENSPEKRLVARANEVALVYKDREIHVRDITLDEHGFLVGQVSDFSNVCTTQYEGLRLGQTITFRHPHVHHLVQPA